MVNLTSSYCSTPPRTLLIGVGNPDRGDDGLGPHIVQSLEGPLSVLVTPIIHSGDGATLMECWDAEDYVVIVDCVRSGASPGTLHRFDAHQDKIPGDFFHYSSHAFGVAEAIELARTLKRLPKVLVIYGIEGKAYDWGSGLSPEVARKVAVICERILDEVIQSAPLRLIELSGAKSCMNSV